MSDGDHWRASVASEPCEHTVVGNWCHVCLKVSGNESCKARNTWGTDSPQDCDWPWCGCFTRCACGEEIPQEFPNEGDSVYWLEKHEDHAQLRKPSPHEPPRMTAKIESAREFVERIAKEVLGLGWTADEMLPDIQARDEQIRAERDKWWRDRGHIDGKGGCFYSDRERLAREAGKVEFMGMVCRECRDKIQGVDASKD